MATSTSQLDGQRPPRLPKSAPKVSLTIVGGPGKGHVVDLTRCVTLIGSRHGCKLQLRSPEVSAVHCAIVNTGEEVFVRDLASSNGTYLNDLPAVLEKLDDGDTIRVADWELRVKVTAYTLDTLSDLPHVSLEPEPTAFGVELNGSGKLVRMKRPIGVVGRRDSCDIVIKDKQVSRVHMLLFTYAGQPVFCDMLSNNGVTLEGHRLGFGVLHSGDALTLGQLAIRMILPGVGRRPAAAEASNMRSVSGSVSGNTDTSTGSGSRTQAPVGGNSESDHPDALGGTRDGTIVPFDDELGDRIDIRAAEIEGR
ncbi:MAG: FHA domain-containing protein [Phycisphaerales bacterium]|nr:FHA domain-containing protein [Phycisphaerales bacterium]